MSIMPKEPPRVIADGKSLPYVYVTGPRSQRVAVPGRSPSGAGAAGISEPFRAADRLANVL